MSVLNGGSVPVDAGAGLDRRLLYSLAAFNLALFLIAALVGYYVPFYGILEGLAQKVEQISRLPLPGQVLFIFLNNMMAGLVIYIASILLALPGLALLGLNGYLVGTAVNFAVEKGGLSLGQALALILPHGVVEIPAIALSSAFGLYCLARCRSLGTVLATTIRMIVTVAPLLLVAAFIEVFITPWVAGLGPGL